MIKEIGRTDLHHACQAVYHLTRSDMVVSIDVHAVPLVLQRFLDLFARDDPFVYGGIGSRVSPFPLDPYEVSRY